MGRGELSPLMFNGIVMLAGDLLALIVLGEEGSLIPLKDLHLCGHVGSCFQGGTLTEHSEPSHLFQVKVLRDTGVWGLF